MPQLKLLIHNIRSIHNVGSLFRTAEGFGVEEIIISGYSPYPTVQNDTRLPHIRDKLTKAIHKTALGAESLVPYSYIADPPIDQLREDGYTIIGLEQDTQSTLIGAYTPHEKTALLLGEEVHGLTNSLRQECDVLLEIPMKGKKESFNVSVAAGIALYHLSNQ